VGRLLSDALQIISGRRAILFPRAHLQYSGASLNSLGFTKVFKALLKKFMACLVILITEAVRPFAKEMVSKAMDWAMLSDRRLK
jgi:hypothetical protein